MLDYEGLRVVPLSLSPGLTRKKTARKKWPRKLCGWESFCDTERDFERDAQRVCWNWKSIWWVSCPRRNAAPYQPRNWNSSQVFDNFLLHITCELAVGNPSAIECQTANILTSRTGLWARCSTSLLEFVKDESLGRDKTPRHTSHEI